MVAPAPPPQLPPEVLAKLAADNKGPETIAIIVAFTALACIVVVLRFTTRFFIIRNAGVEDYLIGLAMVSWTLPRTLILYF
jgi:hypothetical protein